VFPMRYELNLCMLRRRKCTLYPHKLAITSPTSGGRSVGIVRSRTQTVEFSSFLDVEESRPPLWSGYRTEVYCISCEVRTELVYVM
jgi:hypothetical protein